MGYKIDHASTSKLRHALDLFLADPADSPILDDQTVSDTLETGAFHLSDHSTGDSRDDRDKVDPSPTDVLDHDTPTNETDSADKDAEDDDAASRIARRLETISTKAMLEEVTDGTTGRRRYQLKWNQRVLTWFRRR